MSQKFVVISLFATALGAVAVACGTGKDDSRVLLRDMTKEEAQSDFDALVSHVRAEYGPLEYKERRYGFSFEEHVQSYQDQIAAASSDLEYMHLFAKFLGKLDDGHVSIRFNGRTVEGSTRASVPLFVEPFEGKAIVSAVNDSKILEEGIKIGHEVVAVDGEPVSVWLERFSQTDGLANAETKKHLLFKLFSRRIHEGPYFPVKSTVHIELKDEAGNSYSRSLVWRKTDDIGQPNDVRRASIQRMVFQAPKALDINESAGIFKIGSVEPFFLTPQTKAAFAFAPAVASKASRDRFGTNTRVMKEIFSTLYRHKGKTILLVRQPGYSPEKFEDVEKLLAGYRAVLSEFEGIADVAVIDQTHNPGGYLSYCGGMARLFYQKPSPNIVQAFHPDRKWIDDFRQTARSEDPNLQSEAALRYLSNAAIIEKFYDQGASVTEPLTFDGPTIVNPDSEYTWKKPFLVLTDELAGSCGDIFPMLIKASGSGKLFGQRTWGLGGNVENLTLAHSRASVSLTRGLFTAFRENGAYTDESFVENNGVAVDIPYSHTVKDFRQGFTDYVTTFSDAAIDLIKD